jgi:predicted RNA binding protein YcfA (HicA-like mRNA interferase family)
MAMPRKVRELKANLRRAGFLEVRGRGKGSHSFWRHPTYPDLRVTLSGQDGQDVRDYQESQIAVVIAEARRRRG